LVIHTQKLDGEGSRNNKRTSTDQLVGADIRGVLRRKWGIQERKHNWKKG
jgi:hypothetical protein